MTDLEHLIELINSYPADIKAEVLVADLIRAGFPQSDLLILFNSDFKRRYSKDILKAEKRQQGNDREVLALSLARDGLYDMLPEGLFHASPETAVTSGKGMAGESRKETKIEEETRKFFLPFENEFFHHRVQVELLESELLEKLNENKLDDFLLNFWKIDRSLPEELILKLCAMLPFARDIVGNFELTASCLGSILGERVTSTTSYTSVTYADHNSEQPDDSASLGKASLGVNLITGGSYPERCKLVTFSIGPLMKTGIGPYLENGEISRFIDCFFSYFIPMEINTGFDILMPEELKEFALGSDKTQSILGYSTVI